MCESGSLVMNTTVGGRLTSLIAVSNTGAFLVFGLVHVNSSFIKELN